MLSTYVSYRNVNSNIQRSLSRIEKDPMVRKYTEYYTSNISKVKKPADLLDDYRLYSYAMKAYGLEDMTFAKAFMKKVLESDLSDPNSFANKLTDKKYAQFAAAFTTNTGTKIAQTGSQEDKTIGLYSRSLTDEDAQMAEDTAYYNIEMDKVQSVDDLLNDNRLRTFMLKSMGLEPAMSVEELRNVLTSDPLDPNSYVNQLPSDVPGPPDEFGNPTTLPTQKGTFIAMAGVFNFNADGTVKSGMSAQSAEQKKKLTDAYNLTVPTHITPTAQAIKVDYLKDALSKVTNISDITGDARVFSLIKTALGLPSNFLGATLENIVTSDVTKADNYAAQQGGDQYVAIAKLFNFNEDGTVASGKKAAEGSQIDTLIEGYGQHYAETDDIKHADADAYYKTNITKAKTVDDIVNNPKLYGYILKAYGFDPDEVSRWDIRSTLTSDLTKPTNFAALKADKRYTDLAAAFNFGPDGKIALPMLAQDQSKIVAMSRDYVAQKTKLLTGNALKDAQTKAKDESSYYSSALEKVKTATDLLADKRIVDFMLTSKSIDPTKVALNDLKKVFASNLDDPDSFANQQADPRFRELAAQFNFDAKGNVTRPKIEGVQSHGDMLMTVAKHVRQTLEQKEGEDNEGVRLALYFKRMAPGIRSAFDILGDPALTEVFRTAFDLPASMASMDVSKQADILNAKFNIKDLSDPERLEKLVTRFTAMYDMNNSDNSANVALAILGGR